MDEIQYPFNAHIPEQKLDSQLGHGFLSRSHRFNPSPDTGVYTYIGLPPERIADLSDKVDAMVIQSEVWEENAMRMVDESLQKAERINFLTAVSEHILSPEVRKSGGRHIRNLTTSMKEAEAKLDVTKNTIKSKQDVNMDYYASNYPDVVAKNAARRMIGKFQELSDTIGYGQDKMSESEAKGAHLPKTLKSSPRLGDSAERVERVVNREKARSEFAATDAPDFLTVR